MRILSTTRGAVGIKGLVPRVLVMSIACVGLAAAAASPAFAQSTTDFVEEEFLGPRDSRIPAEIVVDSWRWYGIPVLPQLVVLAAETSLGDPDLGGSLVRANNFGGLRYGGSESKWGALADGRTWVAGKDWYSFPTPVEGMMAFGRYLKVGADGRYREALAAPPYDWDSFAAVYYGRGVPGYHGYVQRLERLTASFRDRAAGAGFVW